VSLARPAAGPNGAMTFEDWRDTPACDVEALYDLEGRRWLDRLGWDMAPSWRIVENARLAGHLPGLVARRPDGRPAGWVFYLLHEGILQIGGLAGDTAAAVRRLLERTLQSPEAGLARGFSGFLFPASPSLQSALERQRFLLARHLYLARLLGADGPDPEAAPADLRLRPLAEAEPANIVRLFARAYAGRPEARCFAPDGRLEQWAHYLGQILGSPAVGRYLASASFAIEDGPERKPVGAIVTTSLSAGTAHIAQVVVDPGCRRSGLGRWLLGAARDAARSAGHDRLTLLVAESNEPARALYAREGFEHTAHFLFATRPILARRSIGAPGRRGAGNWQPAAESEPAGEPLAVSGESRRTSPQ
jgi:ribosomal protein S18 acetylase RimI-like enzyme